MLTCFMIAGILGALNVLLAAAVWNFVRNVPQRPRSVRILAGSLGAAGGAALAMPQLRVMIELLGHYGEGAGLIAAFSYPVALPLITGIAGWLFAEMLGGRSRRPARALAASTVAALGASALVFVPLYWLELGGESWLGYPLMLAPIVGACMLGLYWESKSASLQPEG